MAENITPSQQAARRRLSANLKVFRSKRDISQEALADRAGLHRTYISQVERELINVSLDNIVLLAEALGVQVTDLLGEPGELAVPLKPGRKRKDE
ncbi:helix-turn-helix domain-containing protein [Burkholderia pseudomallei]|uniref:helix-turn-helix domain-containing protein n=1 Tax=Burkholderia pseudomallei TaxID=28450 RepID=UPI0022D49F05|nr:helix-turn-helix transcriptional regulator [Burkholderia pseudomallei]MDA0558315.1 helix-turn-helix domain-containing protein [Burkholderia pseudomallei]